MNPYIDDYGTKKWYNKNRQYHREDGPAVEWTDGSKEWWINGKLHREDGPAIDYFNGKKYWYYHGKYIKCSSQEKFEKIIKLRMFW